MTEQKMTIRFILKNGVEFDIKCDEFTLERNGLGDFAGYKAKGVVQNKLIYIDADQVAAIVRLLSDEYQEEDK